VRSYLALGKVLPRCGHKTMSAPAVVSVAVALLAPLSCGGLGAYLLVTGSRDWREAKRRFNAGGSLGWYWFNRFVAGLSFMCGVGFVGFAVFWAVFMRAHLSG